MKSNLAIVILTWNDYKETITCIKSILKQNFNDYKIFIIDNNSNEDIFLKLINWLEFNHKNIFYKKKIHHNIKINEKILSKYNIFFSRNRINQGCGYGHNTGYKIAINNDFKFVARIDNDMQMPKNFLKKILKNFDDKHVQAVSPKIIYKNSKNKIWWMGTHIGNNLKTQRHLRNYEYGIKDSSLYKNKAKTDSIAGCASVMRVDRLKKIGLSDKDFFYGPEDIEFSKRIMIDKHSLIVDLDTKIYHGVSKSFTAIPLKRMYFEYKYRLLLIKKIGSKFDKFFGYSVSIIKFILYILFSFKIRHRRKIKPVFYALLHFYQNKLGDFDRKNNFLI